MKTRHPYQKACNMQILVPVGTEHFRKYGQVHTYKTIIRLFCTTDMAIRNNLRPLVQIA